MAEDDDQRGFRVQDKRRFNAAGDPREQGDDAEADVEEPAAKPQPDAAPMRAAAEAPKAGPAPPKKPVDPLPGPDTEDARPGTVGFSGFVVGLAQQAFMLLGAAPDPASGVVHKDIPQAGAMIDIISMLQEKTVGNLSEDEARLVEEVLYELRMRYVAARREGGGPGDHR